jgi:RimJ/RimL family protein N-acetyltransferase
MMEYLIDWGKDSKVIRKFNLRVRDDNTRAIKLYKKLGFIEEGITTREFYINGKFFDFVRMGLCID